jgi:capsular exopolysaccharide synthesis family protein
MEEKRSTPVSEQNHESEPSSLGLAPVASNSWRTAPQMLWSKLLRGKWTVLFCIAAFALIGLMIGALRTPLYKAQTSIEIQSPAGQHLKLDDVNTPSLESYIQTQIRIIESRSLLERTLAKFSDADRLRLLESPHVWWSNPSYDEKLEAIRRRIVARPSEQAGIVDITFLSPDPAVGAYLLNSLTQELADFDIERAWRTSQHDRQWTDRQLDDLRRKWEQSEQVLAEYSQTSGLATPDPAPKPTLAPGEAQDAQIRQLKRNFATLKAQISQWESLYGPSAPEVLKLKSDLAADLTAIRQRRAVLLKAAADNSGSFAQAGPVVPNREAAIIRLNSLKQEVDTNHQTYDLAATRFRETALAAASHMGDLSVVDPAIPDSRPVTPNHFVYGVIGGLAGLLLGIIFVALRDRFSHTFNDPALLKSYLGIQVLGSIPSDRFSDLEKGFNHANGEPALNLAFDTNGHTAEAYRTIRSSILFKVGASHGARRLVFTSAGVSDGKTAVVANLGAAIASAQRRVLLVDADLRNPGLHKIFGADNDHGLADLLSRQITASPMASREVIRETQIPDLYLLSAGQAGDRAPEILSSAQLPALIREFARGFDIVLVDSPPVLPYADSRCLSRAGDGVVLIVRASSTDRRSALQARDAIVQDGSVIIGAILNDLDIAHAASA